MSPIDVAVVAVIALTALRGFFRGFLREAFSVIAWAGGLVVAVTSTGTLSPSLQRSLGAEPAVASLLSGIALFVGFYVAAQLTGWVLHRAARAAFLGPVDRVAGLTLGSGKGALLCGIVLLGLASQRFVPSFAASVEAAPIAGVVLEVARETRDAMMASVTTASEDERS